MSTYPHELGIDDQEPDDSAYETPAERLADRKADEYSDAAAEVAVRCPTTTILGIPFETASLRAVAPWVQYDSVVFEFTVNGGVAKLSRLSVGGLGD